MQSGMNMSMMIRLMRMIHDDRDDDYDRKDVYDDDDDNVGIDDHNNHNDYDDVKMLLLSMIMIMSLLMMTTMIVIMMVLLMMMMIIGITLRDLVHAIPYYTIQEDMRKMMMILTIYHHPISSNHDYHHLCNISIYHHLYISSYI
jgi:hypothetical protein